jgi:hypothetical protein
LDRRRSRSLGLLTLIAAAATLAAAALAASPPNRPPLRAASWLAASADPVRALGFTRPECFERPTGARAAYLAEVGRAAFRTPLVLGGQAARAGVTCETCHEGGRRNPDFLFPGISGAPGTADVTASLFSSHRDDGIDNPKPIPDLGGPKSALKISQDPKDHALEQFIHGLVTEEFDGAEPPPAVLEGLAAYVRALSPGACPAQALRPLRAQDLMAEARRAVQTADLALQRRDPATAVLMIGSARTELGLIYERYDAPELAPTRSALRAADLELAAIAEAVRRDPRPKAPPEALMAAWSEGATALETRLVREEPKSLFDPARLAGYAHSGAPSRS